MPNLALCLGHPVQRPAGGHAPGVPRDLALGEVGDGVEVLGYDGQRVARGDEEGALAQDHVAVAVAVEGSAKAEVLPLLHGLHQVAGVGQVGVRVAVAKVRQQLRFHEAVLAGSQLLTEDPLSVGAGYAVQRVDEDLVSALDPALDGGEVEDLLAHCHVVADAVHHLHLEVRPSDGELALAGLRDVAVQVGADLVLLDALAERVDALSEVGGRGAAVPQVVLDAKVSLGSAGVVGGGEDDAAGDFALADDVGKGGGGQDPVLAHDQLLDAVGRRHLDDLGAGLLDAVPPVPAHHQGGSLEVVPHRLQRALKEVLHVVWRLQELRDLLPEPRGAGLLPGEGGGRHRAGGGHLGRGGPGVVDDGGDLRGVATTQEKCLWGNYEREDPNW